MNKLSAAPPGSQPLPQPSEEVPSLFPFQFSLLTFGFQFFGGFFYPHNPFVAITGFFACYALFNHLHYLFVRK